MSLTKRETRLPVELPFYHCQPVDLDPYSIHHITTRSPIMAAAVSTPTFPSSPDSRNHLPGRIPEVTTAEASGTERAGVLCRPGLFWQGRRLVGWHEMGLGKGIAALCFQRNLSPQTDGEVEGCVVDDGYRLCQGGGHSLVQRCGMDTLCSALRTALRCFVAF